MKALFSQGIVDFKLSFTTRCSARCSTCLNPQIKEHYDMEEDVFVPLLGAGNAGDSSEIMKALKDILFYNISELRQHITVFIDPKYKSEAQIIELQR